MYHFLDFMYHFLDLGYLNGIYRVWLYNHIKVLYLQAG